MHSDARAALWQSLIAYSGAMLETAGAGEWERLSTMAAERQSRLETFFAEAVPVNMADEVEDGIRRIGELDSAITKLALQARNLFSLDADLLRKRKQAADAYSQPEQHRR